MTCGLTEQVGTPQRGFLIRDVARESGFVSITREALGVRLTTRERRAAGVTFYDVSLEELTGQDRAMTLVYSLPQPSGALVWFHDLRRAMDLDGRMAEVMNTTRRQVGANGQLSRYPFGAVAAAGGCALGIDTATPLYYRLAASLTRSCSWRAISACAGKADGRFPLACSISRHDGFRGALAPLRTLS